jgi:hypothetical protein
MQRSMVAAAAMRMSGSATSVRCSKSRPKRRFLMSQAKLQLTPTGDKVRSISH